jgi:hypothetical protein
MGLLNGDHGVAQHKVHPTAQNEAENRVKKKIKRKRRKEGEGEEGKNRRTPR